MKIFILCCLLIATPLYATDKTREQRWIDQTIDTIFDGEPVYLDAGNHRFLGIYTKSSQASSKNGMIVLHGTGFHPDWEQVVQPVRVGMVEHGWNTLSIQLPILEKSASYEDYVVLYPEVPARIQAAVEFLDKRGAQQLVVVAHSQGATMAAYYLARVENPIAAFVAIGMSAQHIDPEVNSAESLALINIPVLDIYGSRDFPTVLETSEKRRLAASHNARYEQQVIDNAYHFFDNTDHERQLLDRVANWLEKLR